MSQTISRSQSTASFRKRRTVHITASACFVTALILFAILLPTLRAVTLGLAAVFTAYAVILLFDRRKCEWSRTALIAEISAYAIIMIGYIILLILR